MLKEDAGAGVVVPAVHRRWRNDKAPEDATTIEEVTSTFHTARPAPTSA